MKKTNFVEETVECHYDGAVVNIPLSFFLSITMGVPVQKRKFVRYKEGAKMYGMCVNEFLKLAHDAEAVYKRNQTALVNMEILDNYMEYFHE